MTACLRVQDLSVRYGAGRPVLERFSLEIGPGEVVGLVGSSGSGKSTLMLAILGLLPRGAVQTGCIECAGRIGAFFQEPSSALNPVLKIGTQIQEVMRTAGEASRDRALRALAEVELPAERVFDSYPHQLSGGQLQRVLFVQATIVEPVLIIADEPAAALDDDTKAQMMRLFSARRGRTGMLFITHEEELLESFADKVVRL